MKNLKIAIFFLKVSLFATNKLFSHPKDSGLFKKIAF